MRAAICDDEKAMHDTLEKLLREYKLARHIDVYIDKFESGADLLHSAKEYDVVFMDYQMERLDGIETSRLMREKNKDCIIIFVSAYPEAAVDTYEVGTFRFLVKPVNREKLFKALDDYMRSVDRDNLLIIKTRDGVWKIKMSDMIYAEAKGKHTIIRTIKDSFEVALNLKQIESMLPKEKFMRCHKSYIVGFSHVMNHNNAEIIFDNNEKAQIGRNYTVKFKTSFQDYIMRYNER